jgi:hypothetical protein
MTSHLLWNLVTRVCNSLNLSIVVCTYQLWRPDYFSLVCTWELVGPWPGSPLLAIKCISAMVSTLDRGLAGGDDAIEALDSDPLR